MIDLFAGKNVNDLTHHAYGYRLRVGNHQVFFDFDGMEYAYRRCNGRTVIKVHTSSPAAMPNAPKSQSTSRFFYNDQVAAALAAVGPPVQPTGIDWKKAIVTHGGGAAATVAELRRVRGKNKLPTKESVALRIDPDALAAFRADGPGWQTRMNAVLRKSVESRASPKRRVAAKTDA